MYHVTLREMNDMMSATPPSPAVEKCASPTGGVYSNRDVWVHVHSPWHLFFQNNKSLWDNLDPQYVVNQMMFDKIRENINNTQKLPSFSNLKLLVPDKYAGQGWDIRELSKPLHHSNTDSAESTFRAHRLQFDVRPLHTPQYLWFGEAMFCNNFQFSGTLMWERYKVCSHGFESILVECTHGFVTYYVVNFVA
jgi:hypothetical protein